MKLDTSKEMAALAKFSEKTKDFGGAAQTAGQKIMGFGCLMMLIGLICLAFVAIIF